MKFSRACLLSDSRYQIIVVLVFFLASISTVRSHNTQSWEEVYRHFTNEDGLQSSTIFSLLQDQEGYIWIATRNGLSRYDGYTFKPYDTLFHSILKVYQSQSDRIWMQTSTANMPLLFLAEGERVEVFAGGKIAEKTALNKKERGWWAFEVDWNDTVWLTDSERLYKSGGGDFFDQSHLIQKKVQAYRGTHYLKKFHNYSLLIKTANHNEYAVEWKDSVMFNDDTHTILSLDSGAVVRRWATTLRNKDVVIIDRNDLVIVSCDGYIERVRMPEDISPISVYEDSKGNIWVTSMKGIYCFHEGNFRIAPQLYYPDMQIFCILEDHEGGYWLGTENQGLMYFPAMNQFQVFPPDQYHDMFFSLQSQNNRLWFSNDDGLYTFDSTFTFHKELGLEFGEIRRFAIDSYNRIWHHSMILKKTSQWKVQLEDLPYGYPTALDDGRMVIGSFGGKIFISKDSMSTQFDTLSFDGYRLGDAALDSDGSIWLGGTFGLYRYYAHGKGINYSRKGLLKGQIITSLVHMPDDDLVIGTSSSGIFIRHGDSLYRIDQSRGLPSNYIASLYVDNENLIWASTQKGLSCIHIPSYSPLQIDITSFTTTDGLPTSEPSDIMIGYGGYIIATTNRGLLRFRPENVPRNLLPPPIHITDMQVNNQSVQYHRRYTLDHDQDNLLFSFTGISYRASQIHYRYRLLGYQNRWAYTTDRSVQFTSLPPGDYQFQVSAMNKDGIWNSNPAEIRFSIASHFTETVWFTIGLVLLLFPIVGLIVKRVLTIQHKRHEINIQMIELKRKALSSIMSPHFIFNALSSIQNYLNRQGPQGTNREANDFIVRFSRLIRQTMEASEKSFATLEEELDRLELYLKLEARRLEGRLDYRIEVSDRINRKSTLIPTMLIQPYVENSIWHGILPIRRDGMVKIIVDPIDEASYRVSIIDDGVGYDKSRTERKDSHTSLSMRFNRERLELLTQYFGQRFSVEIESRQCSDESLSGTVVKLVLPRTIAADESTLLKTNRKTSRIQY